MQSSYDLSDLGGKLINNNSSYDLSDLGGQLVNNDKIHGVQDIKKNLIQQTQQQSNKPLAQEEYSNPTQYPGFNKLSPQEQMQRIQYSSIDPANQSPTGGYVPPGTLDQPYARMAASTLPQAMLPEFSVGGR